jgi:hypothetical protein
LSFHIHAGLKASTTFYKTHLSNFYKTYLFLQNVSVGEPSFRSAVQERKLVFSRGPAWALQQIVVVDRLFHDAFSHRRGVGALQFTWAGLAVFCITYYVSLSLGIGMAYHRLLTHRSYKRRKPSNISSPSAPRWHWKAARYSGSRPIASIISIPTPTSIRIRRSTAGSGLTWDGYSFGDALHNDNVITAKYAPDLGRDAFHVWISKYHWIPLTTLGLVLLALGGWNWVLWGVFLRTTVGLHSTWLVNLRRTCGARGGSTRETTRATAGGLRRSASEKAGTTTTMHTRRRPPMALRGTRSTSPTAHRALEMLGLATQVRRASIDTDLEAAA